MSIAVNLEVVPSLASLLKLDLSDNFRTVHKLTMSFHVDIAWYFEVQDE